MYISHVMMDPSLRSGRSGLDWRRFALRCLAVVRAAASSQLPRVAGFVDVLRRQKRHGRSKSPVWLLASESTQIQPISAVQPSS